MTDDDTLRAFTRALFGRKPEPVPDPEPDLSDGNHVPREGNNPTAPANDLANFTAALFERAHRD